MSWLPWVRRRHRKLLDSPLPEEWRAIVDRNVPLVRRLDPTGRRRLEGLINVFLDDKTFEGLGGLELTDEVRLTIAAQACLLLVGLEVERPYPGLDVIRVYPRSYRAPHRAVGPGGIVSEGIQHRLGESSQQGYVVLAWDDVRAGTASQDGNNVVLHEFAHQLDTLDGVADGAPVLRDPGMYGPWARILGESYESLREDLERGRPGALDAYGATSPAEFFAVATEAFFERPDQLRRKEPDLHAILTRYYGQEPG